MLGRTPVENERCPLQSESDLLVRLENDARLAGFDLYGFALLCRASEYRRELELLGFTCVLLSEMTTVGKNTFTVHYVGSKIYKPTRRKRGCYVPGLSKR